jgi:hypothetical protein
LRDVVDRQRDDQHGFLLKASRTAWRSLAKYALTSSSFSSSENGVSV